MEVTIGVNGELKVFETSEEYFDWLKESKKAAYMWRNCVDVIGLSNMTDMDIDVVVYERGSEPNYYVFKPDPKFPCKKEDKMKPIDASIKKQGKMTVLNWKNVHYNLIVGPNHMLSQAGSFRFQASNQHQRALPESPGAGVRKEAVLEGGQSGDRQQESGEKVTDQEVPHQKEFSHEDGKDPTWSQVVQKQNRFDCSLCGLKFPTKNKMMKHMEIYDGEEDDASFTCRYCAYQAMNWDQCQEHIERTHKLENASEHVCDLCNMKFKNQKDMNKHSRIIHRKSHKPCRNFPSNNCEYEK